MGTLVTDSPPIALDTLAPQTISVLSVGAVGGSNVFCVWNAATDQTFDHYEIWFGTVQADVQNRTGGAAKWDDIDDAALSSIATTSTTITTVIPGSTYFFTIFAIDQFGQTTSVDASNSLDLFQDITSSNFDLDTLAPQTLASLVVVKVSSTSADATWIAATDTNFNHYEIWLGPVELDVQNKTGASTQWDDNDDTALATIGTTATTITGQTPGSTLFFSIFAVDDFGQETRVDAVGSLLLSEEATDLFDGAATVVDTITDIFDGFIKVFETNPNHFFGNLRVFDVTTDLFDGDFHVGVDSADLFDGSLTIEELSENQFSGSIHVVETATDLFDGTAAVISGSTPQFDGNLIIHKILTTLFDGEVFVFSAATVLFDGLFIVEGAGIVFDGLIVVEALPIVALLRPRDGATEVKESSSVHIEFEGFPAAPGGGLDAASVTIVMLIPKLLTIYDGSTSSLFPNVTVSGDTSRLAFDFRAPFDDEVFPIDSAILFDLSIANLKGQFIDFAYNFNTRTGSGVELRRGEAIYEYDMGTEELNIKEFKWNGNGLIKMRLKFADTVQDLRSTSFEGEEIEVFAGTTIQTSIWNMIAPVFTPSQDEVLIFSGTQSGSTGIWDNETRFEYVGALPRSYNVAIDTRLNIVKSSIQGARSFLEISDAIGNVIRIEKIYRGLPSASTDGTSADIVPDEAVSIVGGVSGSLSVSNVFPQVLTTLSAEIINAQVDVTVNDIALAELERIRIRFTGSAPISVDITVNGVHSVNRITVNSSGFFEVTEGQLFPSLEFGIEEEVERLQTVQFVFRAPDITTTISDLEVLSTAELLDTRLRVVVNGVEEHDVGIVVDPLRFDQLKAEVETGSIDILFNGESVYRKYMKLSNPRFAIGAGARSDGDSLIAEFNNLVIRRYFDRSPVVLNKAQRYTAYEVTMKAPQVDE